MTRASRGTAIAAAVLGVATVTACSSTSDGANDGGASVSDLACLGTLTSFCCGGGGSASQCVADWARAEACASWPASRPPEIYATPCQGLRAVRIAGASYATYYVYDATTSALVAIADDATTGEIACGAGPKGFIVPAECARAWNGGPAASGCLEGQGPPSAGGALCGDGG